MQFQFNFLIRTNEFSSNVTEECEKRYFIFVKKFLKMKN